MKEIDLAQKNESEFLKTIQREVTEVIKEILSLHNLRAGDIFVIGCSSSEVAGNKIGTTSNEKIGQAIFLAANKILSKNKIYLACQCCEHLNRALVIEQECADRYNLDSVTVVPWLKGGGSFATAAYYNFKNPTVVEHIKAAAGLDIGLTLIGMHLKDVAVPVRPSIKQIGSAIITAAYSRPKLIGGERAHYVIENQK